MDVWPYRGLSSQEKSHVIKLDLSLGYHLFNYQSYKQTNTTTSYAIYLDISFLSWMHDVSFPWNHQNPPSFSQAAHRATS